MQTIKRRQIVFILSFIFAQAYTQESGRTFIRNFQSPEYRASQQNWAVTQDSHGIMYFGNNDGLLEFDGISWNLTKLPIVRTIAIDSSGCIFLGLENDMGYLKPDRTGKYQYFSLREKIPDLYRNLSTVQYVYALGKKVIFLADDKIFIYQNDSIKVLTSEKGFHHMFVVHGRLYVREREKGLLYLNNDSLIFIPGSERFAGERVYSMLPYKQKGILIATRTIGIFEYTADGQHGFQKPEGFKDVDDFLLNNPVYCGTVLSNGDFALGALTGGIIVFDAQGKIKTRYNKSTGLQDNTIYWLFSDRNQQLWSALDNGISLVPVNLPFRNYTEQNGLNGSPMCLRFFNNSFYVGTSQYLHKQNELGNFEKIAGTEGQNFQLFDAGGTLLLADYQGVFEIRNKSAIPLENKTGIISLTFCTLRHHPDNLLLGSADDGFYLMENKNSSWKIKLHLDGFNKSIYVALEDKRENIWISTAVDLYKLKINQTLDSVISWKQYTTDDGLPSRFAFPYMLNSGEMVFGTEKGIYRYLDDTDRLIPDPEFSMLTGKILPFNQMKNGDIWYEEQRENGNFEKGVLKYSNGNYSQYKTPFYKFIDIRCYESPFIVSTSPDSTIFIGTSSGLIQYNPSIKFELDRPFNTLIRKVLAKDHLVFGGLKSDTNDSVLLEMNTIPYNVNDLIFHFAATFYEDAEKNLYSYRLIGSDTAWSVWGNDHKKEYTNLREGEYTFEVKAENQYQQTSSTASYSFFILPPWYRTWWAYLAYGVSSLLVIWFIVRINIHRLVKQRDHLEKIVTERTAEVVRQKKQIETAHQEITSSINYARYIQSSVLPKNDQLEACLGEYFILHKPKEIVSGDFYWISGKGNKTIVVVADCTGHGVPGAFMSMLGITLLNEIINKEGITNPGIILDRLRKEVINSLNERGERWELKNGMDVAICTIDRRNMKLQFAGAINSLYLIRNSGMTNSGLVPVESTADNMLIEIKGSRMPIGMSDELENFAFHEIDIIKSDSFYLFSDGFPDQFGGPNHKKFSYKQFREQLIKTKSANISDQKLILEKILSEWMGDNSQTDDILILGFEIN